MSENDFECFREHRRERALNNVSNLDISARFPRSEPIFPSGLRRFGRNDVRCRLKVSSSTLDYRCYGLPPPVVRTPCEPTKIPRIFSVPAAVLADERN